jgi:hypothetical protein
MESGLLSQSSVGWLGQVEVISFRAARALTSKMVVFEGRPPFRSLVRSLSVTRVCRVQSPVVGRKPKLRFIEQIRPADL